MKTPIPSRILTAVFSLGGLLLLTGCFDTSEVFTLNPDGSGKVVHESAFQTFDLSGGGDMSEEGLKDAIAGIIRDSKGVEVWRDVTYKRLDDGRLYFKGTAYFTNLARLEIPNQTMLDFKWRVSGDSAVLTLRTNKGGADDLPAEKASVDLASLTPTERAKKLREERAKFQQMKPMLSGFLSAMKQDVTFHLPGTIQKSSNFTKDSPGALGLQFDGAKLLAALEQLINDDDWVAMNLGSFGGEEKPAMDDAVNAMVFGEKAPVRAEVHVGNTPLFDYAAEAAAAQTQMERIRQELGMGSVTVTVAAPASGQPLKGVKVVGARFVGETGRQEDGFRPFNYDPGYTLVLLIDFPGSILGLTDESMLLSAVADDGTSLLPSREWDRKIRFPKLSADKASALIETKLTLPGPHVKGLKELSGRLEYQAADTTKEVDLGFDALTADARGKELGAQIKSFKKGWKDDGSQQVELKLNLPKETLKSLYLVSDGTKTELERRGYFGGGNSYTFTYEYETNFPTDGRLVVEVYDQMQTFVAPFKLQNISLLGTPLEAAR